MRFWQNKNEFKTIKHKHIPKSSTHVHIYAHTRINTHSHIHTFTHTLTQKHTQTQTHLHAYTHIHTFTHTMTHTHTHTHVHTHAYTNTNTYVHTHKHTHTHVHRRTSCASPNNATTNSRSLASDWCTHASMSLIYRLESCAWISMGRGMPLGPPRVRAVMKRCRSCVCVCECMCAIKDVACH